MKKIILLLKISCHRERPTDYSNFQTICHLLHFRYSALSMHFSLAHWLIYDIMTTGYFISNLSTYMLCVMNIRLVAIKEDVVICCLCINSKLKLLSTSNRVHKLLTSIQIRFSGGFCGMSNAKNIKLYTVFCHRSACT